MGLNFEGAVTWAFEFEDSPISRDSEYSRRMEFRCRF